MNYLLTSVLFKPCPNFGLPLRWFPTIRRGIFIYHNQLQTLTFDSLEENPTTQIGSEGSLAEIVFPSLRLCDEFIIESMDSLMTVTLSALNRVGALVLVASPNPILTAPALIHASALILNSAQARNYVPFVVPP